MEIYLWQFASRDFAHASDMMEFLGTHTPLQMAGACYPEKHFESFSMESVSLAVEGLFMV